MAIAGVTAFWAVSFLLVLVPGADWAYAIAAGLRHRTIVPAVAGLLSGYLVLTAVVAAGLATLVARSPLVLTGLTAVGAVYLLWLGVTTVARSSAFRVPAPQSADGADVVDGVDGAGGVDGRVAGAVESWQTRLVRGAGISGLNPKALLLFVALLPQFVLPGASWPFTAQIAVLGLVHTANCGFVYAGVGTAARRVLRARPTAATWVTRCSGVAMLAIGAFLLVERLLA